MTNALTTKKPLPISALAERPLQRLPDWVQEMSRAIAATTYSDHSRETFLAVPPTDEQRAMIEAGRSQLVAQLDQTPQNYPAELESKMIDAISALILSKPYSADAGALRAEAIISSFQSTLRDIPIWATLRAIENWRRGDCASFDDPKDKYAYKWMPDTSEVRSIAMRYVRDLKDRIQKFDDILLAVKPGEEPNVQKLAPPPSYGGFKSIGEIAKEIAIHI